jgi:glycosyltransferase involved in cell wall biosynthesis
VENRSGLSAAATLRASSAFSKKDSMKIALVHDFLCNLGGSERIFQYICEEFADADAYTLAYNPCKTLPYFSTRDIRTTWLNRFVQSRDSFRWSFPIATYAMESLDLRQYDIVLSSSATVAKYIKVPNGKHICYCYIPTRAIWHFDEYFQNGFKAKAFKPFLPYLRKRDYAAAQKIDKFIAISNASSKYIKQYYHRCSEVINCPVNLEQFAPSQNRKNHYLIVSRLDQWKRVDYAVEAFNRLGLPLRIVGSGEQESQLKAMAKSNIIFVGRVDDATLAREYAEATAVVFTPFLEYGLTPLEASASGTPVICYGKGGITETMIPLEDRVPSNAPPTAVFFQEQTADALIDAVRRFDASQFNTRDLVNHASHWGVPAFKKKIRCAVDSMIATIYDNENQGFC